MEFLCTVLPHGLRQDLHVLRQERARVDAKSTSAEARVSEVIVRHLELVPLRLVRHHHVATLREEVARHVGPAGDVISGFGPVPHVDPEAVEVLVCQLVDPLVAQPELAHQAPEAVLVVQPGPVEILRAVLPALDQGPRLVFVELADDRETFLGQRCHDDVGPVRGVAQAPYVLTIWNQISGI